MNNNERDFSPLFAQKKNNRKGETQSQNTGFLYYSTEICFNWFKLLFPGQTQFSLAPAESPIPVPQQSQAAFAPSFMNQYSAHTLPAQQATTEMVMNADAKSDIPQGSSQASATATTILFGVHSFNSLSKKQINKKENSR